MTNTERPKNSTDNIKNTHTHLSYTGKTLEYAAVGSELKTHYFWLQIFPKNTTTYEEVLQKLSLLSSGLKDIFNKKPYEEHVILNAINWIQKKLNQFEDDEFVLQMADELRPWERLE